MTDKIPPYLLRIDAEAGQKSAFASAEKSFQEDIVILRSSVADLRDELARLDVQSKLLQAERDQSLARCEQLKIRCEQLQQQLNAIISSSSWRITRPLRALLKRYPGVAKVFRHASKFTE